jgi:hypothetical protein
MGFHLLKRKFLALSFEQAIHQTSSSHTHKMVFKIQVGRNLFINPGASDLVNARPYFLYLRVAHKRALVKEILQR